MATSNNNRQAVTGCSLELLVSQLSGDRFRRNGQAGNDQELIDWPRFECRNKVRWPEKQRCRRRQ